MVVTPTYYGVSANVRALAEVTHAHGLPLITDDAWGLDYSFCSRLPPSALESGADLAIGSVHKTLNVVRADVGAQRAGRADRHVAVGARVRAGAVHERVRAVAVLDRCGAQGVRARRGGAA